MALWRQHKKPPGNFASKIHFYQCFLSPRFDSRLIEVYNQNDKLLLARAKRLQNKVKCAKSLHKALLPAIGRKK
jgi:hypothetical protein